MTESLFFILNLTPRPANRANLLESRLKVHPLIFNFFLKKTKGISITYSDHQFTKYRVLVVCLCKIQLAMEILTLIYSISLYSAVIMITLVDLQSLIWAVRCTGCV